MVRSDFIRREVSLETEPLKPTVVVALTAVTLLTDISVSVLFPASSGITLFMAEATLIIPTGCYLWKKGYSLQNLFRIRRVSWHILLVSILVGLATGVLNNAMDLVVHSSFPMPKNLEQRLGHWLYPDATNALFTQIVGLIAGAAICEELFFRGFIQTALERWHRPLNAIGIASVLFALAHFNPWWVPSILFAGVIFGLLAYTTDSVLPGILAHAVNNGFTLFIIRLEPDGLSTISERPIVVAFAGIVLSLTLMRLLRQKLF